MATLQEALGSRFPSLSRAHALTHTRARERVPHLSVGLDHHAPAQVVLDQGLVGLSEAELPRQARVLDSSPAAGPSAAIVPRNQNVVREALQ